MTSHLGYEKHDPTGRRSGKQPTPGTTGKTVLTNAGGGPGRAARPQPALPIADRVQGADPAEEVKQIDHRAGLARDEHRRYPRPRRQTGNRQHTLGGMSSIDKPAQALQIAQICTHHYWIGIRLMSAPIGGPPCVELPSYGSVSSRKALRQAWATGGLRPTLPQAQGRGLRPLSLPSLRRDGRPAMHRRSGP